MADITNVLVVCTSTLGNTKKMADRVADGARSVPATTAILREASEATKEEVRICDALLLGTPIRHRLSELERHVFLRNNSCSIWRELSIYWL
jgi:NAD(P)H dehydrogenase (quinone)